MLKGVLMMLVILCTIHVVYAQEIAENENTNVQVKDSTYHKFSYFRIGFDATKLLKSQLAKDYKTIEFQVDVNYTKSTNLAVEFGTGNSIVNNQFLNYKSNNTFIRLGIDKTFFGKEFPGDMDNAFVGVRYAFSRVNRLGATYTIQDNVWGNTSGTIDASAFVAHWIELNGGFRMEIIKNVFAGWNIRAKTFLNPKKFELLPPTYLSGYGRGDKNTAFDYNFYILYGIGKRK